MIAVGWPSISKPLLAVSHLFRDATPAGHLATTRTQASSMFRPWSLTISRGTERASSRGYYALWKSLTSLIMANCWESMNCLEKKLIFFSFLSSFFLGINCGTMERQDGTDEVEIEFDQLRWWTNFANSETLECTRWKKVLQNNSSLE